MTNEDAISRLYRRAMQAYAAVKGDGGDMASEEAMLDYLAYCTAIDALERPIDEASYLQGFEDGIAGERALVAHKNPPND